MPVVEPAFAVSEPAELPFCELADWPCSEALDCAPIEVLPVALVSLWVLVEGEAVVVEEVEGEVVEVAPALPLTEPLCEPLLCPAVAGCVQGWLLVLPVALPVVPPVVDVEEAEGEELELEELEGDVAAEPVAELSCAGVVGVTEEVP